MGSLSQLKNYLLIFTILEGFPKQAMLQLPIAQKLGIGTGAATEGYTLALATSVDLGEFPYPVIEHYYPILDVIQALATDHHDTSSTT